MNFWPSFLRPRRPSLPDLFERSEEDFVDATFCIFRHSRQTDGSNIFHLRATHSGTTLGFVVETSSDWRSDTIAEGIPVFWESVRYRSLGNESDAFVRALASAYGTRAARPMAPTVQFAAIALKGNPMTFADGPVDMKLFYESDEEDRYAEVYTNLDLVQRLAEVREKDSGYRSSLVLALTSGPPN